MAITEDAIRDALKAVNDPEIGMSIMDLGLVYDIEIDGEDNVTVEMTLTTPGCPLGDVLSREIDAACRDAGAASAVIHLIWNPPWTPEMMSEEAKERLGWGIR